MRIGFIDCSSGISGDMLLGALVDAGLSLTVLKNELAKLPVQGQFDISVHQVKRGGIYGICVKKLCKDNVHHRHLEEITKIVKQSSLDTACKERASKIFLCLAEAEAAVHHTTADKVHLHEVGTLDSIIDVVGCVIGLQVLGIEQIFTSPVALGGGTVEFSHGVVPVPTPATAELLKGYSVVHNENVKGELCTPTGAALVKALSSGVRSDIPMFIRATGYGAGSKQYDGILDLLSIWIGDV